MDNRIYLISPDKKQYKANLHCHSVFSDGKKTPEELKEMYQRNGYSILAITDHETPKSHNELTDSDFIMITGYECYIRPTEGGRGDIFTREIHLNLFARDPENETMICYNNRYLKYMDEEAKDALTKAGSERPREYTTEYINEYIHTAQKNGYLVSYNHPYWSRETEARILSYEGYFSMELCNYSAYIMNHLEYNAPLYDMMLSHGKHVFCHSGDDNHNLYPEDDPKCDSYGAFTMMMPEEFTYGGIIDAMEKGEMYSSMGPTFKEIYLEGDKLHVECSEVVQICVYFGSKIPRHELAPKGCTMTSADFTIHPESRYIRVSIFDKYGKSADTRGFFRDELGMPPLEEQEM
ncbi:MAG: PHP domain-containing protein [Lachnospiraceae bacterium]|nr:PHP domain-containing protein [Lachnospiraceae bacterium]